MSDKNNYQKLPPGWDCKYDQATGNCYYFNYITRMMQLEDPRYKQLQNEQCSTESIPLQPMQSSPYHVYPRNNLTAIQAFQSGSMSSNQLFGSPMLSRSYLERSGQTASKLSVVQTPRLGHGARRQTIQETSFSSNKINTDLIVTKIQNMFPTAGENHIRLLLKKYYNREAVVISALQVEKHPVTMPGPFVTPPAQRHVFHASNEHNIPNFHVPPAPRQLEGARIMSSMLDSRTHYNRGIRELDRLGGTPPASPYVSDDNWRQSPVPCSSPKMKLRYMKNIFPKAEETFLLDILASGDNNVQKASERLISMGYVKRNFVPNSRKANTTDQAAKEGEIEQLESKKPVVPKELTTEEKKEMQTRLQEQNSFVPEHLILMALESVNYDEIKAQKILQIMRSDTDEQAEIENKKQEQAKIANHLEMQTVKTQIDAVDNINIMAATNIEKDAEINNEKRKNLSLKLLPRKAFLFAKFRNANKPTTTTSSPISSISTTTTTTTTTTTSITSTSYSSSRNSCTIASTCVLSPTSDEKNTNNINNNINNSINNIINNYTNQSGSSKTHCALSSSTYTMSSASNKHCLSHSSTTTTQALDDATKTSMRRLTTARSLDMPKKQEFQSILERIVIMGHNPDLVNGPNEGILLADYVTWNGANVHNAHGNQQDLRTGPDASIRNERVYMARGHNSSLCKGAQANLSKGSIYAAKYATKTSANIKCN